MDAIQLTNASTEIQEKLVKLSGDDATKVGGFLQRVVDYRAMLQRGDYAAAGRYHETLMSELEQLRGHYSDIKMYGRAGAAAAAGAAAGAWLFGIGAPAGGLAGGAIGYLLAKKQKVEMLKLCDLLLLELGPRAR